MIADQYARTSNPYKPLEKSDIPQEYSEPNSVAPHVVNKIIKSMNKKSSEGRHPFIYKTEVVTPSPKVYPPLLIKHLRKIS